MLIQFFEYFFSPESFEVKTDLSYKKLRDETLDLISQLPDSNPNKERLNKKIEDMYPEKPKVVGKYKMKLQQINRRVNRIVNG